MEMQVVDILNRMDEFLNDSVRVRWPETTRRRFILDAQQAIIAAESKASVVGYEDITLTEGLVKQTPPALAGGSLRAIHDVTHNVLGGQVRDSIRYISRAQMDAQRPNWMRESKASAIRYWMPVEGEQGSFYVYPPPKAGVVVRVQTSYYPTSIDFAELVVRPEFKAAVIHLAVAYCWMKDDTPGDRENVGTHLALASNALQAAGLADEKLIARIVVRSPPR